MQCRQLGPPVPDVLENALVVLPRAPVAVVHDLEPDRLEQQDLRHPRAVPKVDRRRVVLVDPRLVPDRNTKCQDIKTNEKW